MLVYLIDEDQNKNDRSRVICCVNPNAYEIVQVGQASRFLGFSYREEFRLAAPYGVRSFKSFCFPSIVPLGFCSGSNCSSRLTAHDVRIQAGSLERHLPIAYDSFRLTAIQTVQTSYTKCVPNINLKFRLHQLLHELEFAPAV